MRLLACSTLMVALSLGAPALAQTTVASTHQTYVCPKCGKVHASPVTPVGQATATTTVPVATTNPMVPSTGQVRTTTDSPLRSTGGVSNVLAALNAQRARQGVPSLRYDPELQAVAQRRVQLMAASGTKNHPPGSFAPGRYEGVGWSSSYSPAAVSACYTSDARMRYAGAAMAPGRDGVYFAVVYR